ncbi:MAG: hypothetical protein BWZ00_01051 [Bacteroidetes bacterium ADurb.BinA174]|nr:MAG: hypothetical protein BWZ00_01051 [Bacteroidetes bacterium ADurb.BinA174]
MKTKSNNKRLLTAISIGLLVVTAIIVLFVKVFNPKPIVKEETCANLKDFIITIEMTDNGIKMQSLEGSTWVDLSFHPLTKIPQAIDEYGMTKLWKVSNEKNPNLADYLITIAKTKNGVNLKGLEGTAWEKLNFSLQNGDKQSINQFGMTD